MIEDLLTRDERIRLECLNQANGVIASGNYGRFNTEERIDVAKEFEKYVRGEDA